MASLRRLWSLFVDWTEILHGCSPQQTASMNWRNLKIKIFHFLFIPNHTVLILSLGFFLTAIVIFAIFVEATANPEQ